MTQIRDEAFKYYFYFLQERMEIFWHRYHGDRYPYSSDTIFSTYKFTNVYRACDRVSQFLIRDVIYNGLKGLDDQDVLLRILIFKVFNRIDTWQYLEKEHGPLSVKNFKISDITNSLENRIKLTPIFNSAYMMTGAHRDYLHYKSKHERWLYMIKREMIDQGRLRKILAAKSLEKIVELLSECAFIGCFLSYQYAIDFNYSPVVNFDENSFVKAGIGAIRGIRKCFPGTGIKEYDNLIRYTQDNLPRFQDKYGYTKFKPLFGRHPTLIDLQNCFCETDKYLRVVMPDLKVDNIRIKQKFTTPKDEIEYFFPPKWNINQ